VSTGHPGQRVYGAASSTRPTERCAATAAQDRRVSSRQLVFCASDQDDNLITTARAAAADAIASRIAARSASTASAISPRCLGASAGYGS
jgi:hypothetical protein